MKKKILIVCGQEIIKERNDGGKLCSYRNLELFQHVFGKENVWLTMFSKYEDAGEDEQIMRLPSHKNKICKAFDVLTGHMFTSAVNEKRVLDFIKKEKIDIVVFERSMFGSLMKKIKRECQCKMWVFIENIEQQYFKNKLVHRGPVYLLPYLCVSRSERQSLGAADYIMALTERDSRLLNEKYQVKADIILPMTFKDRYDSSQKIQEKGDKELLFIGTMFPPNYDGIKWFVENVMPEMKDYTLKIVGKNFEQKKKELERDNVQVIGTVDDLSPYYYSNRVMVMPIFYGDGMKVKTAESIMYGKVIFASDEALEGYETDGTEGIYRCNTKEEYMDAIRSFFEGGDVSGYSESVRQLFVDKYSFNQQAENCRKEWME